MFASGTLAACSGGTTKTFSDTFAEHEALLAHVDTVQDINLVDSLPTGSVTYSGVMAMTLDVDAMPQPPLKVTEAGGDFRAAGDFSIAVEFGNTNTLSGTVSNLTADEGHSFAAGDMLIIEPSMLTGNTFIAGYSGALTLDTFALDVTGGTTVDGQFKRPAGEFIWGGHTATISWVGPGGAPSGTVSGGFVGLLE